KASGKRRAIVGQSIAGEPTGNRRAIGGAINRRAIEVQSSRQLSSNRRESIKAIVEQSSGNRRAM
ncbi:MAG: hypothetical protein RR821_07885, partial [Clostridia bacterium]